MAALFLVSRRTNTDIELYSFGITSIILKKKHEYVYNTNFGWTLSQLKYIWWNNTEETLSHNLDIATDTGSEDEENSPIPQ